MLSRLSISNFVLIDSLDITFPEGLIIITGQTGAGKSILLGALSLLTGAKADAGQISEGADSCVIEGEFDIDPKNVELKKVLEDNDVEWNNGHLIVRRVVHRSGRSRSFVNDCPVQIGVLSTIAESVVDIHSQHKSLILTDKKFQLSVLDLYAKNTEVLARCRSEYDALRKLKTEIEVARGQLAEITRHRDYNEAQLTQLESAKLCVGELEELEEEQRKLANAEEIKENLCATEEALAPESADAVNPGISAVLRDCSRRLQRIAAFVPSAEALAARLESSRIEIDDILSEVSELNSSMDISPERLTAVEERMSLLYELMKKHNCQGIAELIAIREQLSQEINGTADLEEKIAELERLIDDTSARYDGICAQLDKSRRAAAEPFAAAVEKTLRYLELDRATFKVEVETSADGPDGKNEVRFLFSAVGNSPADIAKCASGGELSRIMLSLKAMMAGLTQMPTMIFDEIDTGVSGSVADKMGSMICSLGQSMQVFAITHLPQVAAKGNVHYLVSKSADGQDGKFRSTITALDDEGRIMELARMLSGSNITEEAIANARALVKR